MKAIAAVTLLVAFVVAEPPPSNSYLPPAPSSRGGAGGYPQSSQGNLPQVVAARSLNQGFGRDHGPSGHGAAANGLARNSLATGAHGAHGAFGAQGPHQGPNARGAQPRFNDQQGYEQKSQGYEQSAAFARNALGDANAEPASYNFGYMVNDHEEGTDFGHHEERQEESAHGEYHVVLPDGRKQTVSYEADEGGFKPQISYEDTEDLTRSGYDSNANNFRSNNGYPEQHGGHQNGGHNQNGGHANARSNGYN